MHSSLRVVALSAAVLAVASPAAAVRAPQHLQGRPALEVKAGVAARPVAQLGKHTPPALLPPWASFLDQRGARWSALWDRATGVPSRIYGQGIEAPGAVADAATAARHARATLRAHIALLAPGASADDFELVSNQVDHGMRTVGFVQRHQGLRVVGGQVSFRYKHDRLFVIASEALPHVRLPSRAAARASAVDLRAAALEWVRADAATRARAVAVGEPVILPIVGPDRVEGYHEVVPVTVAAEAPVGRWRVYVDAATGSAVAREQTLRFATGRVLYNAPERYPGGGRVDYPARGAQLVVNGVEAIADDTDGSITWDTEAPVTVTVAAIGPLVAVTNVAGAAASANLVVVPDGDAIWDGSGQEQVDAQLATFIHARIVKDYARTLNPDLEWLDSQQKVNVNIDDTCNAFSDGNSINFFRSSQDCANTGRLADVVYHEFGHSLHAHSIIEGVGAFDGALSEGLSDYLAATITGDPAMGRGFFKSDDPLRHIDPADGEHMWPQDIQGVHYTGLIISGALWDLRKLLIANLGEEEGIALTDRLFYAVMQRATNIPSSYIEVLAADDDDGDLTNGTPNVCDINAAFAAHGLRAVSAEIDPLGVEPAADGGHMVGLRVTGLSPQCPGDSVAGAAIHWSLRGAEDSGGEIEMAEVDGRYEAAIPSVPAGSVVEYKVVVDFADGSSEEYPTNPADPLYQFYVGEVVELYCTDFETDPFKSGWTHGLTEGQAGPGADDWAWGPLLAGAGSGDPVAAFSGERVLGNDLGARDQDGRYQPDKTNFALSPVVEVDDYTDVRIQYWRWLDVEDGYFDKATVYVNDEVAWQNFNSNNGNGSNIHHQDREWRFHDIAASELVVDGALQVKFEIDSDPGLEFGGWTIDDFCIVANADSICGDGTVSGVEECDEGDANSDSGTCRSDCTLPVCGDGTVDVGEACDDGNDVDDDECASDCTLPGASEGGCGCRAGGDGLPGAAVLWVVAAVVFGARRRRRGRA